MADDAPSFDTPPASGLDQLASARAEGYGWDDINTHLAQGSVAAAQEGYSQSEIDQHLGYDTDSFHPAAKQLAVGRLADDPDTLDDIHNGDPFELPTMRSDYAAALYNGTAKGPDDFASGLAAATLDAAHDTHGLDDSNPAMVRRRQAMAQDAADGLAQTLPTQPDLVDAALHLSNGDAEPAPFLMKNLLDHWTDTGMQPVQAALAAETDDGLNAKLTNPNSAFPDGRAPTLEELSQPARDAIEKVDMMGEQFILDQPDIPHAIAAAGFEIATAHMGTMLFKDVVVPLARMAQDKLGFIPQWIEKSLADAPPVKVVDLAAEPGAAVKEISAVEAFKTVEPAKMIPGTVNGEVVPLEPHEMTPVQLVNKARISEDTNILGERKAIPGSTDVVEPATIDPVATPYQQIQRVLQLEHENIRLQMEDTSGAAAGTSTFFQDKLKFEMENPNYFADLVAKNEREGRLTPNREVTELAQSHDTSRNMLSTFRSMMGDESGAIPLPAYRTPAEAAKRDAFLENRDYARDMLTKTQGITDRHTAHWAKELEPYFKLENKHRAEWDAEINKGPAGNPMMTKTGQLLDYAEGRSAGVTLADGTFKPMADTIRALNQDLDKGLRQRDVDGTITYKGYVQDHVRHYAVDPNKAEETFLGAGKFGDRGATKQRKYPTYGDMIAANIEPKYRSVLEGELKNATGTIKFMHYADMLKEMRDNYTNGGPGLYWGFSPKGANDIAIDHPIGRNAIPMEKTVAQQAAAVQARADRNAAVAAARAKGAVTKADLDAIRARYNPIIEAGKPEARIQSLYGNRGLVQELNKYSALRFKTETGADVYNAIMQTKNLSTAFKLMLPLAHAGQVIIGTAAHGVAQAMEELGRSGKAALRGNFDIAADQLRRSAWSAAKSATFVGQAGERYIRGQMKVIPDYVKLKDDEALNIMTDAGFRPINPRAASAEAIGGENLWTAGRRGALGREFKEDVKGIFGDPRTETPFKRAVLAGSGIRPLQFGFHYAQSLMTTFTAPAFDHAIPAIKAGAMYDRFNSWLQANLGASYEVKLAKARQIITQVENNLGELNFNNVFWNNTAKKIMNAGMLSSTWTYGTARSIASVIGYDVDRNKFDASLAATGAATMVGFAASYVWANNIMQYLHTGTMPMFGQEGTHWQENFNYRTKSGKLGFIFSEIKEVYDLGKIVATAVGRRDPTAVGPAFLDYALAKIMPFGRFVHDFFTGKDAVGKQIANTPHGWLGYLKENFGPIFMQSFAQLKKGTGLTSAEIAMGWREAPLYVSDPQKYLQQQKGLSDKWTKEELRRAQRENAQLENPDPTIAAPTSGGTARGGSNAGVQQKRSGDYQPRPGDATNAQARSLDYQPRPGDATGAQARSLDYQPRPDNGPSPGQPRGGGARGGSRSGSRSGGSRSGGARAPRPPRSRTNPRRRF